jgi:hypothetical protein
VFDALGEQVPEELDQHRPLARAGGGECLARNWLPAVALVSVSTSRSSGCTTPGLMETLS